MAWLILVASGLLEAVWAVGLKMSDGFTRLTPSLVTVAGMAASLAGLAWALKVLPVGTAYAVWTGIGAAGAAILGIFLLDEPAGALRLASIGLIVLGVAGLRFTS